MDKSENPQAFPSGFIGSAQSENGMTLLDYFAGQAFVWLLADDAPPITEGATLDNSNIIAQSSYDIAEAMLKERQKRIK